MCSCAMSSAMCRCQALHGGSDALALAAVMQNLHTYYKQFQFLVQEDLQKGLAPIEKHLKACLPRPISHPSISSRAGAVGQMTLMRAALP